MRTAARVFVFIVLSGLAWQTLTAQESTPPVEVTPEVVILTPSETPTLTPTPTLTATPTAAFTPTSELTAEVTEESLPTATSEPETTAAPEFTDEPQATSELTAEVTADVTFVPAESATPTLTETPTATFTPSPTATPLLTLDFRLMPTATVGIPMVYISGTARYQNRLPDHSGITVYVANGDWVLLSKAVTDAAGAYTVAVPSDTFYWLVLEAPLHKRSQLGLWPGDPLPGLLMMAGGDLTGDGCVGTEDIRVLTAYYDQLGSTVSDITGDGLTDVSDLAILTGNFDPACELLLTPPVTPEATPTMTAVPESTAETTPEITPEP